MTMMPPVWARSPDPAKQNARCLTIGSGRSCFWAAAGRLYGGPAPSAHRDGADLFDQLGLG